MRTRLRIPTLTPLAAADFVITTFVLSVLVSALLAFAPVKMPGFTTDIGPEPAAAGRLYVYKCRLPDGLGDGYGNKVRTGLPKNSANRAITSAMNAMPKSGWSISGPNWLGQWDLYEDGQIVYTFIPTCWQKSVVRVK